jgi:hypothetical protein
MKPSKLLLGLVSLSLVAVATAGREFLTVPAPPAEGMIDAAQRFVAALSPEQRAKAMMSFDDADRSRWHFVPREMHPRKGLLVQDMSPEIRPLAHALLHSGLGQPGYLKATTIMSLESVLHRLEPGGRLQRNPELYYFSVFGEPSAKTRWGWRVEGHHLSLNFVVDQGRIVSATPAFFGANPARIKDGTSRTGLVTLPREEDLARKLFHTLKDEQRKASLIAEQPPNDIRETTLKLPEDERVGLLASRMTDAQTTVLLDLITEYAQRMPAALAEVWLREIRDAGTGKIHFAWAGGDQPGQPHYYRIEGPTFLIEYANVQKGGDGQPANHIHSVWRSMLSDFAQGG